MLVFVIHAINERSGFAAGSWSEACLGVSEPSGVLVLRWVHAHTELRSEPIRRHRRYQGRLARKGRPIMHVCDDRLGQ